MYERSNFSPMFIGEIRKPNCNIYIAVSKLIEKDKDENKLVDTYIVANADFLVSNDSSITQLKNNNFPPPNLLSLKEFSNFLNSQSL